ncbi:MAG TPA: O-antigen ligase family protein [Candidatus Saccharimonadales bacterium]|nr:O-antigen ligase family protein [Candidatus Saccharimonadales bacterium]
MRASAFKYRILSLVTTLAMLMILLLPFHAFLTVWGASMISHYTALRLWKEVLLLVCIAGVLYLAVTDGKIRAHTLTRRLVWLIMLYVAVNVGWGLVAFHQHTLTAKALGYGLIVNLRFLVFFLVTWSLALRTSRLRKSWQWLVLAPVAVVVVFGLLQALVLPHDFLTHFGYGPNTIEPVETINHNAQYLRIASTLRGANPLGAYLLIPISLLAGLLITGRRTWPYISLFVGSLLTLFFSFSRSAWIGAALALIVIGIHYLDRKYLKQALAAIVCVLVLAVAVFTAFEWHHNTRFQNIFLHTQTHSAVKATSDQGHIAGLRAGLHDLVHQPFGRGPGSAGPASVYNTGAPRIAENYFLQIGQETGWIGLILFILINIGVGYILWLKREDPLALTLFASLIGLTFINLFSHGWTDDTTAYIWWGLAGIAMVMPRKNER